MRRPVSPQCLAEAEACPEWRSALTQRWARLRKLRQALPRLPPVSGVTEARSSQQMIDDEPFGVTRWPRCMVFLTGGQTNTDACQLCFDKEQRFFGIGLDVTVDGSVLTKVTAPSYLPRSTCFHLINVDGVVGPAAVVVKLDVPSHTLHLDLPRGTDRETDQQTQGNV